MSADGLVCWITVSNAHSGNAHRGHFGLALTRMPAAGIHHGETAMARARKVRFITSKTAHNAYFKKPKGFEAWFYTGGTRDWGHNPPKKGKK